jgi:hypothetical protein
MNSQPPGLVEQTLNGRRRGRRGRQLDRPVEGESNESTRKPARWLSGGGGKGGWRTSSAPNATGLGRRRSRQKGRRGWSSARDEKEGERSRRHERRNDGVDRGAAGLYTRAKRRGGALPDRAGLNPTRQRTCNETTPANSNYPVLPCCGPDTAI